ncbi:MAG: hypothetical protein C0404_05965 [Verrucomicrobia bacterium]|nr:hypothetical protein [Verrucomicrobiota bacterium]
MNTCTTAEEIIRSLASSRNVCDKRKAHDITGLIQAGSGEWKDRFYVAGFANTGAAELAVVCYLQAAGLVWDGSGPAPHSNWLIALEIPQRYPLLMPVAKFLKQVPWNSHVFSKHFMPDNGLPPELQEMVRLVSHGWCCFLRHSQWSPDVRVMSLRTIVWQISRLLVQSKMAGEKNSLNAAARDHALRRAQAGEGPLGPPLPYPFDDAAQAAAAMAPQAEGDSGEIEWKEG